VWRFDGDGALRWRQASVGGDLRDVAVRDDGDVIVAGVVGADVVVRRLAASDGVIVWQRALVGGASASPRLAAAPGGDVLVAAGIDGDARPGVQRLAGADGATAWALALEGSARAPAGIVRPLALAGGDVVLGVPGDEAPEVVRLAAHMAVVWTRETLGGEGARAITAVAGDRSGAHWVVGAFTHGVALDGARLDGGGGFVLRRPIGIGY